MAFRWCPATGRDSISSHAAPGTDRFAAEQAPGLLYPAHVHDATEVHLVVAGRARWRRGSEGWTWRAPGRFVLHGGRMPHAALTRDEPLLALAVWLDHLDCPSRMV